jgi:chromosome segregation ATPase
MSINVKKYTKDQMAKMVEEATERQEAAEAEAAAHFKAGVKLAEENEKLRGEIGTLTEKLDQMNGEAITRENEIANLKADADVLRNKLADTEAALGRANDDLAFKGTVIDVMRDKRYNAEQRANYAESHPWRNLWAWVKRKLKMA